MTEIVNDAIKACSWRWKPNREKEKKAQKGNNRGQKKKQRAREGFQRWKTKKNEKEVGTEQRKNLDKGRKSRFS